MEKNDPTYSAHGIKTSQAHPTLSARKNLNNPKNILFFIIQPAKITAH
jgi:hypothetical protein